MVSKATMGQVVNKNRLPILRGVHWVAHRMLPAARFKLELRRSGELKLGLWRRTISTGKPPGKPKSRSRKRFVIVPGFGDTPLSWLPVALILLPVLRRRGFDEIVLVDFPGFRGSLAREKSFHSMDLLMENLFDAFDSLKPHTILGHSLGGWLTARYAGLCGTGERGPGPHTIILADPSGVFGDESLKVTFANRFKMVMAEGFDHLRPHVFAREPFWFRFLVDEFRSFASDQDIIEFMKSVREDHFVEELIKHIKAKTWLVWGEKDTLCPTACLSGWMRNLPKGAKPRAILLKNIGHSPQLENAPATAAVVTEILLGRKTPLLPRQISKRWWDVVEATGLEAN